MAGVAGIIVFAGLAAFGIAAVLGSGSRPKQTGTLGTGVPPALPPRASAGAPLLLSSPKPSVIDVTSRAIAAARTSAIPLIKANHALYTVAHAFDGTPETAWCEGDPGDGVGSYIEIDLVPSVTVVAIELQGGWAYMSPEAAKHQPPGDMWELSLVATSIEVQTGIDRQTVTFSRENDRGRGKTVDIPPGTRQIRITVRSIHRVIRSASNVCLDGIRLWGH